MKIIVSHFNPDVDALTAIWLIKNFLPGWEEADIAFVPAGETLGGKLVDSDPEVLHVDTGLGKLDHHQIAKKTCAARLVFEYLKYLKVKCLSPGQLRDKKLKVIWHEEALERLVKVVVDIDHFGQVNWPNPESDIYDFTLEAMLDGWKLLHHGNDDREVVEWGMRGLNGIYQTLINKIWAEDELAKKGLTFQTKWGKAMAIESVNDETVSIAQKQGFVLAVRKDLKKGYVRIKARPGSEVDLSSIFEKLKKRDAQATWFLHISRLMVLNGTTKNPKMKPTRLGLGEIVEIIKNAK